MKHRVNSHSCRKVQSVVIAFLIVIIFLLNLIPFEVSCDLFMNYLGFSSWKTSSSLLLSHPFTLIVMRVTKLGISDGKGVR